MLKVTFDVVTGSGDGVSVVMHLLNAGDAPILNIRTWLTDCTDLFQPSNIRLVTPTPVPMIARGGSFTLPVSLSRFPRGASDSRPLRTDWVYVHVQFEGLLGADVTEEWYWERFEWEGLEEPVLGHGEKLVLSRIAGTTGAEPGDVHWERAN